MGFMADLSRIDVVMTLHVATADEAMF